jgi:hypothetical protein
MEVVFTLNAQLISFDYSLDYRPAPAVLAGSDTIDSIRGSDKKQGRV